ncbi:MAG: hypothetical protein CVU07_09980, partial [Bacteroidetes bacterium HGW-Bacteroidetes-23]
FASTDALVDGTIYYGAQVDPITGCESSVRLAVTVTVGDAPTPTTSNANPVFCLADNATVANIQVNETNVIWFDLPIGGNVIDLATTLVNGQVLYGSISDGTGCESAERLQVTVSVVVCADITITKTVDNLNPAINENVIFTIVVANTGMEIFSNVVVRDLLPSGYRFVSATTSVGNYASSSGEWIIPSLGSMSDAALQITAEVLGFGDYTNIAFIDSSDPGDSDGSNNSSQVTIVPICLTVFNEFSPNNDGFNDFFIIDCIENFPNNRVEVYNRYGNLVFEKSGYKNNWDGKANVSGAYRKNEGLPVGTYFYIIKFGDGLSKTKTGWLFIAK